ncbi:MAG: hypothetical protein QOF49_2298 [Chloroflexota bacterium]|jgi:PPOX class probable F420-dependent enzyme|nr:hypothetical protein [Chloroflexota bacterium]
MTDAPVLDATARSFLAHARTATLATTGPTGQPRLVPICFVVRDDPPDSGNRLYSPLDDKPKRATDVRDLARVRDLVARPRAALLVDRWSEDWTQLGWIRLDAEAALVEPAAIRDVERPDEHDWAIAALRAKYPQYATHRLDDRPVLKFTVVRARSWGNLGG